MNFYQEFKVGKELDPYVECFWLLYIENGDIHGLNKVLPDNSYELIFSRYVISRKNDSNSELLFSGKSHLTTLKLNEQSIKLGPRVEFIGARIKAHAISCFWNLQPKNQINKVIDARDLIPQKFESRITLLESKIAHSIRLTVLNDLLLSQLKINDAFTYSSVEQAMGMIEENHGNIKVSELSSGLNCSSKTLSRYFMEYVGTTPKVYARLCRFRYFMKYYLNQDSKSSINECALKFGFYDKNHLRKEIASLISQESQLLLTSKKPNKLSLQSYILQRSGLALTD